MIRVLAVSSWGTACGIAEHTKLVSSAVASADSEIAVWTPGSETLDPEVTMRLVTQGAHPVQSDARAQVIWLNHHDGLHSRWERNHIINLQARGVKVLVTYHDTLADQNSAKAHMTHRWADAMIVHEPVADLPRAVYLRQGVPALRGVYQTNYTDLGGWPRPVLGTTGFDFPWKNYTRLAALTAEIGWGFMLLSNNITPRIPELRTINPHLLVYDGFRPTDEIVSRLAGCTATAFMYECANTGTSGAIRLGIAARKPVYALGTCRQFRDLLLAEQQSDEGQLINWVYNWETLRRLLVQSWPVDCDPAMVYLAEHDSLDKVGEAYAQIIHGLVAP